MKRLLIVTLLTALVAVAATPALAADYAIPRRAIISCAAYTDAPYLYYNNTDQLWHCTSTAPLILNTATVTSTATEINRLHSVTPGTVAASKFVAVDANKHIDVLGLPAGGLKIGATGSEVAVASTAAELNTLNTVTAGTVAASKAVVVNAAKAIDTIGVTGALVFGGTGTAGDAGSATLLAKTIINVADNTATDIATVTVPNAINGAAIRVTAMGMLGDGDSTDSKIYMIGISRIAGAATKATASTATAVGATTGATANATLTISVTGMTGGNTATQTFTIQGKVARSAGASTNHVIVIKIELLNAKATGITIA
jgi:hypothetical protein